MVFVPFSLMVFHGHSQAPREGRGNREARRSAALALGVKDRGPMSGRNRKWVGVQPKTWILAGDFMGYSDEELLASGEWREL